MLDATKTLFLDSGHEHSVANERSGDVAVISVETEDVHAVTPAKSVRPRTSDSRSLK